MEPRQSGRIYDKSEVGEWMHLDYSAGSGSASERADEMDRDGVVENDGRSLTNTGFNPSEATYSKPVYRDGEWRNKWRWLNTLNDGYQPSYWTDEDEEDDAGAEERRQRNKQADLERDIEVACNQFGMSGVQTDRVKELLGKLDSFGQDFHGQNKPIEATILAAVTLVANQDEWMVRSKPKTNGGQPKFDVIRKGFSKRGDEITRKDIRVIRRKLRDYL